MNQTTFRSRLRGIFLAAVALAMSAGRHTAKAHPFASKLQSNDSRSPRFFPLTDFAVMITACSAYIGMAIKLGFEVKQPALAGMGGNGFGRRDLNAKRIAVHNAWASMFGRTKGSVSAREPGAFRIQNGTTGAIGQVQVCGQRPDDSGVSRNRSRH